MVKSVATIVVCVLALSLTAFAASPPLFTPGYIISWEHTWDHSRNHQGDPNAVPEPGDLLGLGTGMLLGFEYLRRKLSVR